MSEIKFRAWDYDNECMYDDSQIVIHEGTVFIGRIKFVNQISQDTELMQYTGLKDKNGIEIYEGDIVVTDEYLWFADGVPNYRGTVEWVFSQWQVIAHCINPLKSGISDGMNYGMNDDGIEENQNSEWEVIGNIYENPELLKDE